METNTEPLKTIRDFIRYCTTRLYSSEATFNHGYQNPEEEAAFLVLRTLRIPLEYEEKFLDATLTGNERETVLNNISRRCDDLEPTAYITKEWWLTGFPFYVDERVLIPRSYIAELIEKNFDGLLPDPARIHSILDMCTGSGCLAILLAEKFPQAEVDAVDISSDALEVLKSTSPTTNSKIVSIRFKAICSRICRTRNTISLFRIRPMSRKLPWKDFLRNTVTSLL